MLLRCPTRRPRRGCLVGSPVLPGRRFGPVEPRATGVRNPSLVKLGVRPAPSPFPRAGPAPGWEGAVHEVVTPWLIVRPFGWFFLGHPRAPRAVPFPGASGLEEYPWLRTGARPGVLRCFAGRRAAWAVFHVAPPGGAPLPLLGVLVVPLSWFRLSSPCFGDSVWKVRYPWFRMLLPPCLEGCSTWMSALGTWSPGLGFRFPSAVLCRAARRCLRALAPRLGFQRRRRGSLVPSSVLSGRV